MSWDSDALQAPVQGHDAVERHADTEVRTLVDAFRGAAGGPRAAAVRSGLDRALASWWSDGILPSPALLRDGLLLLEADQDLGESQRTLLLRSALAYDRGVVTALSHQSDPERTGLLVYAALTERNPAGGERLTLARLRDLALADPSSAEWFRWLQLEADARAEADPSLRPLAVKLHALMSSAEAAIADPLPPPGQPAAELNRSAPATRQRSWVRPVLIALAVLLVGAMLAERELRLRAREAIAVPGGSYALANETNDVRTVALDPFAIDRFEVTVAAYRRCAGAGACPWPDSSAGPSDYFTDRAYARYPMILVDWHAANSFCDWAGMRLPTADEWQTAASYAPATGRYYRYPWGATPESQLANSRQTGQGAPQEVGRYHPYGSSPMGMADAAGNVAEWTATPSDAGAYQVKGGSFMDDLEALTMSATASAASESAQPWLGFRCAASPQ